MGKTRFVDLTNKKFGKLTAIKTAGKNKARQYLWYCECECGGNSIVIGSNLIRGNTVACGCVRQTDIANRTRKHGMSKTRLFKIWAGMRKRCLNPKCKSYKNYGGRGIKIDERWDSFENFYEDVHKTYSDNLSLDRFPNTNGNYSPDNFRWATSKDQNNNRRSNVIINFNNESKTLSEWAKLSGIHSTVISYRIKNGWEIKDAIYKPTLQKNKLKNISQYLVF